MIVYSHLCNRMTFSRVDSRVRMLRFPDVSATNSVPVCRVCWWFGGTETSGKLHILTRLSARENLIEPRCRESFKTYVIKSTNARAQNVLSRLINPLNRELNPICCLLALLGAHHFLHVSRIRVKSLTFRRLMSYIYIYIYIWSTHSRCF